MSVNQRQHIRFSLEVPAFIQTKYGERQAILLQQISIGGCFTEWDESLFPGDELRVEIELPTGGVLPLRSKAVYRFENTGIGVRFTDISRFEQQLVADVITHCMERDGLPVMIDPFERPTATFESMEARRDAVRAAQEPADTAAADDGASGQAG